MVLSGTLYFGVGTKWDDSKLKPYPTGTFFSEPKDTPHFDGHWSPDGKKIKEENTKTERKTKWDAGKLVSEVSGLGQGKIVETYALDAEHKQLKVTLNIEGAQQKATVNRTYDADPR